jgi:hypothetical protein
MPRPAAASRLFHTIVVMGASFGCGSPEPTRATGPSGPDAAQPPTGSMDASDNAVDTGVPVTRPKSVCDCARPGEFRCHACASGDAPIQGRCMKGDGTECVCDTSVPIAAPTDCAHPEQFACAASPELDAAAMGFALTAGDWFAFANCTCDTSRLLMASQCTCEQCTFQCATMTGCSSPVSDADASLLRWSCACEVLPPPILIK